MADRIFKVQGAGGKSGSGARAPRIAPDSLYNNATAFLLDFLGHGPIGGLVVDNIPSSTVTSEGATVSTTQRKQGAIFFDQIPLSAEGGGVLENNFEGVTWEERLGYPDNAVISGFNQTVVDSESTSTQKVSFGSPSTVVSLKSDTGVDEIIVTLSVNALSSITENGDINPATIEYSVELKEGSSGEWYTIIESDSITGKIASPYQKEHLIQPQDTTLTEYSVRINRLTEDFDDPNLPQYPRRTGDLNFLQAQALRNLKLTYPDLAIVGLIINARDFGDRILSRQYDVKGLLIQVPSNYDPDTRTYTGFWDGSFVRKWSNNPAWVVYDLITNRRYGLGGYLAEAFVNKYKLYSIAQYCDAVVASGDDFIFEGVPDGKGGVEPRYTFNAIINTQEDAYNLISSFCGMMAVMPYAGSLGIDFGQDSPRDEDILVSPANIIEGSQSYTSPEVKEMYSRINVTWVNPDNDYKTDIEVVESNELIQRFGVRELDVTAYACTSRGQARRYGKLLLDNELYGSEILTYQCGLDHAYIRPGMIIAHSDPQHDSIRKSGRLKHVGPVILARGTSWNSTVELDSSFSFEEGVDYTLYITDKYGNVKTVEIVNPGTSTNTVDIVSYDYNDEFTSDINDSAMYMITYTNLEKRLFRVISMTQDDDNLFTVTAVLHDPNKYARVEKNEILPPPRTSEYPTSPRLSSIDPEGIGHEEYMYRAGATVKAGVLLSWDQPKNYLASDLNIGDGRISSFEIQYKYTEQQTTADFDAPWVSAGLTNALFIEIDDTATGSYIFRVRAKDDSSRTSNWSEYGPVYLDILLDPPSNVQNFRGHASAEQMVLSWDKNTELNVEGYEIRFSSSQTGATWVGSNKIEIEVSSNVTSVEVPLNTGTYLIKAFTFAGKYSLQSALVISNMASSYNYNAIETVTEETSFIGLKTRTEVASSELRLTQQPVMDDWGVMDGVDPMDYGSQGYTPNGYYEFAGVVDLGAKYTSSVSFNLDADVVDLAGGSNPVLSDIYFNPLSGATPLSGEASQLQEGEDLGVTIEVSETSTSLDMDNVDDNGSDVTSSVIAGGAGGVAIFSADNEYLIVGSADTFNDINFILGTVSSTDIAATFEYSTGSGTWATFTPTDDTNGFTESGRVIWSLDDIPGWKYGAGSEFLIRITRTEDTVSTTPVLDTVQNLNATQDLNYILDNAADITSTVSSGGAGNVSIFEADNETITIGNLDRFDKISILLDTVSSADILPTFEYSTGASSWTTFTPTDGTSGFTQSGIISWSLSDIPNWVRSTGSNFLIRITRTEDTVVTTPIIDKVEELDNAWGLYNPITFNDYTAQAFKFRVYMFTSNFKYSPSISTLQTSVDMPDRISASSSTITSGATTYSVTYANAFYETPSVGITAHNMGAGDYYTISNNTKTGFDIDFYNNTPTQVSRDFDWMAKGYGIKQ